MLTFILLCKDMELLDSVQRRAVKLLKGLEKKACVEHLDNLACSREKERKGSGRLHGCLQFPHEEK